MSGGSVVRWTGHGLTIWTRSIQWDSTHSSLCSSVPGTGPRAGGRGETARSWLLLWQPPGTWPCPPSATEHCSQHLSVKQNESCSVVSDSLQPQQAPLSTEISRQEYRSGLPCPLQGDLPNAGIEPRSPALQVDIFFFLPSAPPGKPRLS